MGYPKAKKPCDCIFVDTEDIVTQEDGTVFIFVAMDGYSRYVMGFEVRKSKTLADYNDFIHDTIINHHDLKQPTSKINLFVDIDPADAAGFGTQLDCFKSIHYDREYCLIHTLEFRIEMYKKLGEMK